MKLTPNEVLYRQIRSYKVEKGTNGDYVVNEYYKRKLVKSYNADLTKEQAVKFQRNMQFDRYDGIKANKNPLRHAFLEVFNLHINFELDNARQDYQFTGDCDYFFSELSTFSNKLSAKTINEYIAMFQERVDKVEAKFCAYPNRYHCYPHDFNFAELIRAVDTAKIKLEAERQPTYKFYYVVRVPPVATDYRRIKIDRQGDNFPVYYLDAAGEIPRLGEIKVDSDDGSHSYVRNDGLTLTLSSDTEMDDIKGEIANFNDFCNDGNANDATADGSFEHSAKYGCYVERIPPLIED